MKIQVYIDASPKFITFYANLSKSHYVNDHDHVHDRVTTIVLNFVQFHAVFNNRS